MFVVHQCKFVTIDKNPVTDIALTKCEKKILGQNDSLQLIKIICISCCLQERMVRMQKKDRKTFTKKNLH